MNNRPTLGSGIRTEMSDLVSEEPNYIAFEILDFTFNKSQLEDFINANSDDLKWKAATQESIEFIVPHRNTHKIMLYNISVSNEDKILGKKLLDLFSEGYADLFYNRPKKEENHQVSNSVLLNHLIKDVCNLEHQLLLFSPEDTEEIHISPISYATNLIKQFKETQNSIEKSIAKGSPVIFEVNKDNIDKFLGGNHA